MKQDTPNPVEAAPSDPCTVEPQASTDHGSLARRSTRGMLVTLASYGGGRIVVLGLTVVLARILLPADFGLATAGLAVIAFLDAALDLGVSASVVYDQERGITRRVRVAASLALGTSAAVCIAGVLASPLLARLFDAPGQAALFAVVFLYPLFRGAGQVQDAVLKRDMRFGRRACIDLSRALVRVLVSVPLALQGAGPLAIVVGIVASELVAMLLLWVSVPIRPSLRIRRGEVAPLVRFGGAVSAIRILGSLRTSVDSVVIGAVAGAAALGYYGVAVKVPELAVASVLWIFAAVAFPTYAKARTRGPAALQDTVVKATRLVTLYGMGVGALLAVLARDLVPLMFSDVWGPAVLPMVLISLGLAWSAVGWASGDAFPAVGRPGLLLKLDVPATIVLLTALVLAAPHGIAVVAAAHLVFNVLYAAIRIQLCVAVIGIAWRRMGAALAPGFVCAAAVLAVGGLVSTHLEAGTWTSLLTVAAAGGLTAVLVSLLLARSAVLEVVRAVRSPRVAEPVGAGA